MFSYALTTGELGSIAIWCLYSGLSTLAASTYFHLPVDEEEDRDIDNYQRKYLTWVAEPSASSSSHLARDRPHTNHEPKGVVLSPNAGVIKDVLATDDLYQILSVSKNTTLDKMTLRRAYLLRSKACHPECVAFRIASSVSSRSTYIRAGYVLTVSFPTTQMQRMPSRRLPLHMRCFPNHT